MRDMNPLHNPSSNPDFNPLTKEPVYYLSHPLAADDKYSFAENVAHAKKIMRLCYDANIRCIAPYLTIIEVLDDDNADHRRIGLECDCSVAYALGRIILSGHRVSSGMQHELDAVKRRFDVTRTSLRPPIILDLVSIPDAKVLETLVQLRETLFG